MYNDISAVHAGSSGFLTESSDLAGKIWLGYPNACVRGVTETGHAAWRRRKEDAFTASKKLLHMTGVRVRQHRLDRPLVFSIGIGEQLNGGGSKALP